MSVELINTNQSSTDEENIFSNTEAELALIGCILWDNRSYEKIAQFISTLDKYSLKKGSPFNLKLIKEVLKMV